MSKLNVIGFEITEGTSSKTGKPYSIGKLHTILPLGAASTKGENVAKGCMGSEYRCEVSVLRKVQHLQPPFVVDAEFQDVMQFGERRQDIVSLSPVSLTPAAQAGKSVVHA
jgi:hypothetical protein